MKSVLISILMLGLCVSVAQARKISVDYVPSDSTYASVPPVTNYGVTTQQPFYTSSMDVGRNEGFNSLLVTIDGADVDISYELSNDGTNWYIPYDNSSGTLASDNTVGTGVTADRWIVFTARLANFIRFYIDPDKSGLLSLKYFFQEGR